MTTDTAYGMTFHRKVALAYVKTAVGVIGFTLPSMSRDTYETTHFESDERFKEFKAALRDAGEVTIQVQCEGLADMDEFYVDYRNDQPVEYRIKWPDIGGVADSGELFDFSGLITNIEPETPIDNRITFSITIKLSGKPAYFV